MNFLKKKVEFFWGNFVEFSYKNFCLGGNFPLKFSEKYFFKIKIFQFLLAIINKN